MSASEFALWSLKMWGYSMGILWLTAGFLAFLLIFLNEIFPDFGPDHKKDFYLACVILLIFSPFLVIPLIVFSLTGFIGLACAWETYDHRAYRTGRWLYKMRHGTPKKPDLKIVKGD